MASAMIGRANCPECGFEAAHVKQSEKCLYRYCPECGSQHYAKSQRQRDDLMAKTRITTTPAPGATVPGATATVPGATTSSGTATATGEPPKRRGLFQ